MKLDSLHIHHISDERYARSSTATIEIPSVGKLDIKDCFSDSVVETLKAEALEFAKEKLNWKEIS